MSKANFNRALFVFFFLTFFLMAACSTPEEKKSARIAKALELSDAGAYATAIEILETLTVEYPNDLDVLSSIGKVYTAEGDHTMASFFLEQAYLQAPEDTERLFEAYRSLRAAEQPAGHLLEKLAEQAPDVMDAQLWARLGQDREAANQIQPALNAYLKSAESSSDSAELAAAIGQLYIKIDNLAQAEAWLERAADNDDPNAMTALFGLLEVKLRQKDWPSAEATLEQLDTQFPGAVEASQWKPARQELIRWRKAQDAMQARLAKAETEKEAERLAAEAAAEAEAAQAEQPSAPQLEADTTDNSPGTEITRSEIGSEDAEDSTNGGKAQIITDLEAAEAMAHLPAIETAEPNAVEETSQAAAAPVLPAPLELAATAELSSALGNGFAQDPPTTGSQNIEELLTDAALAERDRDFKLAIRKYWAAISISNQRAEVWNLLSRAYLINGQINNAETSALEAVRLAPGEVAYTLDYLRVAQRSKNADAFLTDLETAYDRFPSSPEITLSLARAHERISGETAIARSLYLRFIDIAPNHPLVPEAEAAASRL